MDDIRVLGTTKESVQRGLIHIDTTLKSLGILLQTKKTTVRRVEDINTEVDRLAAQLSQIDQRWKEPDPAELAAPDPILELSLEEVALHAEPLAARQVQSGAKPTYRSVQRRLRDLFWQSKRSMDGADEEPFADRHLRFCLYRLEPDAAIASAILDYLVERPWLAEIIAVYLCRCALDVSIVESLRAIVSNHSVYDSVVALAIDVLLRKRVPLRSSHGLFKAWLTTATRDWSLLCAAAMALGESSENLSVLLSTLEADSPSLRRMAVIQALRLAKGANEACLVCRHAIRDPSPIVIDALLYLLYNEWSLTLRHLDLGAEQPSEYCVRSARGYDSTLPEVQADYIRHVWSRDYSVECPVPVDFHALLKAQYNRAVEFLWQAQISFLSNSDRYVSQLDLFHEELLYPIMVDELSLKPTRQDLARVELTGRIEMLLARERPLATFASAIRTCRRLRANPETHSRLHGQLTATSSVGWRQRNALRKSLCAGYQELVNWLADRSP